MNQTLNLRVQLLGIWSGVAYMLLILIGWAVIAGFIPPLPPSTPIEKVVELYQGDYTRIRIGMVLVMLSALLFCPLGAVTCQRLTKIEGTPGVLTYTAMLGAVGNMVLTFYPAIWWLVAAYRPDRGDDLIYLLNDAAWLQFIGGLSIFLGMPAAVAAGALLDRSAAPVFPRWFGYYSLWAIILMLPDQLLFFFHSGPFSWAGLLSLWVPVGVFTSWIVLLIILLRKSVLSELGTVEADIPGALRA